MHRNSREHPAAPMERPKPDLQHNVRAILHRT